MKLSNAFSGALRTFAYFMASGSHYYICHLDYLELYGEEPSVIEQVFAIYANVIELDEDGEVLNGRYAQERACQYIRHYMEKDYVVEPPYEEWELSLWYPPSLEDKIGPNHNG
ncbi:DUF7677 family protein [Flammeovirga aprica]|uniref:DUF7677 domain-containing protein n=1 Tax=Flammeovirga aprica JL-4 TaxID=694437 RepID=A0A7X9RX02_9BACT|nr:hypothetical protein [Flammeovirga aprica]NME70234.1 hypothetical protein [Flammeovirga aprica JL-4]